MPTPRQSPSPSLPAPLTNCPCGAKVLTGETAPGVTVTLELGIPTYVVVWLSDKPAPQLRQSAGYPVHRCPHEHHHQGETL